MDNRLEFLDTTRPLAPLVSAICLITTIKLRSFPLLALLLREGIEVELLHQWVGCLSFFRLLGNVIGDNCRTQSWISYSKSSLHICVDDLVIGDNSRGNIRLTMCPIGLNLL